MNFNLHFFNILYILFILIKSEISQNLNSTDVPFYFSSRSDEIFYNSYDTCIMQDGSIILAYYRKFTSQIIYSSYILEEGLFIHKINNKNESKIKINLEKFKTEEIPDNISILCLSDGDILILWNTNIYLNSELKYSKIYIQKLDYFLNTIGEITIIEDNPTDKFELINLPDKKRFAIILSVENNLIWKLFSYKFKLISVATIDDIKNGNQFSTCFSNSLNFYGVIYDLNKIKLYDGENNFIKEISNLYQINKIACSESTKSFAFDSNDGVFSYLISDNTKRIKICKNCLIESIININIRNFLVFYKFNDYYDQDNFINFKFVDLDYGAFTEISIKTDNIYITNFKNYKISENKILLVYTSIDKYTISSKIIDVSIYLNRIEEFKKVSELSSLALKCNQFSALIYLKEETMTQINFEEILSIKSESIKVKIKIQPKYGKLYFNNETQIVVDKDYDLKSIYYKLSELKEDFFYYTIKTQTTESNLCQANITTLLNLICNDIEVDKMLTNNLKIRFDKLSFTNDENFNLYMKNGIQIIFDEMPKQTKFRISDTILKSLDKINLSDEFEIIPTLKQFQTIDYFSYKLIDNNNRQSNPCKIKLIYADDWFFPLMIVFICVISLIIIIIIGYFIFRKLGANLNYREPLDKLEENPQAENGLQKVPILNVENSSKNLIEQINYDRAPNYTENNQIELARYKSETNALNNSKRHSD